MCTHVYESPLYELSSRSLVCLRLHWEVSRAEHREKNGDKGATQTLEAAILHLAQGLLRATGTATGPRAVKGVGSHTTQGRLRPVQCSG